MRRLLGSVAGAVLLLAPPAHGQASPIMDLLLRARVALNDLHYGEADSLATTVLGAFDARLSSAQRIQVYAIRAAAAYPDPAGGGTQRADDATGFLRQLIRLDPSATQVPADLSWPGLDSLFRRTRGATFAAGVQPESTYTLVGPSDEARLESFATRPARARLTLANAAGATLWTDSGGPAERVTLRVRGFAGATPLASGDYRLTVVMHDSLSGDSVMLRFPVTVEAQPLDLLPTPRFDSAQLRPEVTSPARARGLVAGLLLGGGAAAAALVRGPAPLSTVSADGTAYGVAVVMALGAIVAGRMDHGRPIPENAAANVRLRASFAQSLQQADAENRRRVAALRVVMTVHPESP